MRVEEGRIADNPVFVDFANVRLHLGRDLFANEGSEAYDRGAKFAHYRRLPSLKYYILLSQAEPLVERYERQESNDWLLTELRGLNATLNLPALDIHIPVRDLYERIAFTEPQL